MGMGSKWTALSLLLVGCATQPKTTIEPAPTSSPLSAFTPKHFVTVRALQDAPPPNEVRNQTDANEFARSLLRENLAARSTITTDKHIASQLRLPETAVDLSVSDMRRVRVKKNIEIRAQIRLAVSNKNGRMLSVMTSGAKVLVPRHLFDKSHEPTMRKEAIEGAVGQIEADFARYLSQQKKLAYR